MVKDIKSQELPEVSWLFIQDCISKSNPDRGCGAYVLVRGHVLSGPG